MYTESDIKEICKMGLGESTYPEVNKFAMSVIDGLRNVNKYGVKVVSTEGVFEGTNKEYTEIKINVPNKSCIVIDGIEMSGKNLAKWYKNNVKEFIRLTMNIADITTNGSILQGEEFTNEELEELLEGLFKVKVKIRDEEWTKEKADKAETDFNRELSDTIRKVKEENDGYVEV